jgi:dTMP kinase
MRGKLIIVEGTDCSGKETQTNLLFEKMHQDKISVYKTGFPMYDSPTGRIIGGPYLGKSYIGEGWFNEGASNVDPKVAALYFAADRKYNINKINEMLNNGTNVILDRYVYSNMAHQGGKIHNLHERMEMYNWLDTLEFKLLELPKPDIAIFLHMPYEQACILKQHRAEAADQHESSKEHLKNAEEAYLELARIYNWKKIECVSNGNIRYIDDINNEVYNYVINVLSKDKQK